MYSRSPNGTFSFPKEARTVVVTGGNPNYSKPDDWEKMNALGVSQYGQMTAGSYMYITARNCARNYHNRFKWFS
jgi:urocanate hydratase